MNRANQIIDQQAEVDLFLMKGEKREEVPVRLRSKKLGIAWGAKIYQQVFNIASQRGLATKLEKNVAVEQEG